MPRWNCLLAVACALCLPGPLLAAEPLHQQIDRLIEAAGKGQPASPLVDDAGFLRRVSLDLAGTIPASPAARAFLDSKSPDKRARLVDQLLAGPDYPRRMQEAFHVMLMERLGDHPEWSAYLHRSFATNKPWDQMAREILRARPGAPETRGAAFFLSKRLESYGANPVDYPALARDVGRLFLGRDLQCAQCHDHLFIKDYKQADFQGLFAFIQNAFVQDASFPTVGERPLGRKTAFQSVFGKVKKETGPRLPGGKEVAIPTLAKTELYLEPPDPKTRFPGILRFSPLAELSREAPAAPDFAPNIVNRLWWLMMGRGLAHPLDLRHRKNPPSHPEVLALLAREFIAHKYDIKWLLRQLALTRAYQRSSELPEGQTRLHPERFLTALEKRLSAEQMLWATLQATGERDRVVAASRAKPAPAKGKGKPVPSALEQARLRFVAAFAGPRREPEDDRAPSLKGALFLLNDSTVLSWLAPRPGNLIDRLNAQGDSGRLAEELYLAVLTRRPDDSERALVAKSLAGKTGQDRTRALARLAWALLASTEFGVNH